MDFPCCIGEMPAKYYKVYTNRKPLESTTIYQLTPKNNIELLLSYAQITVCN